MEENTKNLTKTRVYHKSGMILTQDHNGCAYIMNSYNGGWIALDYHGVHALRRLLAAYRRDQLREKREG